MDTGNHVPAARACDLVDVVTVNWNAGVQLAECVRSVEALDEDIIRRFIIVDNGSRDGSADFSQTWPKLKIDKVGDNLGFGRACNRGVAQGDAPFVLFLNPDTRLTEPAISKAVAFLQSAEGRPYGVCGIKLVNDEEGVTRHCARFPTLATFMSIMLGVHKLFPRVAPGLLMSDFDHLSSRPVDHVQGAFYLIRREVFESLAGFDDDYFVYFEDLDLSLRLHQGGMGCYYLADASSYHLGGGTSSQVKGIARFYGTQARLLYVRKHFSAPASAMHIAVTYLVEPILAVLWDLIKYRGGGLREIGKAYRLLAADTPAMFRKRARPRPAPRLREITSSGGDQVRPGVPAHG